MVRKFKEGDIIKGLKNTYEVTNEKMKQAIVIEVLGEVMRIKILEHLNDKHVGVICRVVNSTEYFELVKNEVESSNENVDVTLIKNFMTRLKIEEMIINGLKITNLDLREEE